MPSLIRLLILLLFLAGLGYGAMFALVAFVEPKQKEITVKIPTRDLLGESNKVPVGGEADPAPATETTPAPAVETAAPIAPGANQDTPE
jgi:hypothetical protein